MTNEWHRIETVTTENEGEFVVPVAGDDPAKTTILFRNWLTSLQPGYVSMKFATRDPALAKRYNWKDHWNFEAIPQRQPRLQFDGKTTVQRISYSIARPSHDLATKVTTTKFREVPNFAWRQSKMSKYMTTSE